MVNKLTLPAKQNDVVNKINELVDAKQDTLVSGTNIKTINNTSILGSGNIEVGGSYTAGTGIDITNDVISVTSDISTAATLGATAVQPADLASVATSGSYNDLSNKPDLSAKANIDLSNITSAGKNIANWSTNVTNCITEIPQDIKLELNNGTLTLKAGSKVYVPNGAGVFDEIIIASDKTVKTYSITGSVFVFIRQDGSVVYGNQLVSTANSGTTPNNGLYYKTDTNEINIYNRGILQDGKFSLPIAICTVNSGTVSSIDQVFNGFGYIGSTVFALPGVKGLIPNGRNADGSLNNIEFVNNSVRTYTSTNSFDNCPVIFGPDRLYALSQFKIEDNPSRIPTSGQWFSYYSPKDNRIYQSDNGGDWFITSGYIIGNETVLSSKITSFTPKTAFHAVDYSDSSWLSGLGMPSSRYIDLTLGASGSTYTAPANGWFFVQKATGSSVGYIFLENTSNNMTGICLSPAGYYGADAYLPCKKGDVVVCAYDMTGATNIFRFIYAEGETNV